MRERTEIEMMRKILLFAAAGEVATGAVLLLAPSLAGQLLLGGELTGIAIAVARVAGIALIGLGIACWPVADKEGGTPAFWGMFCYGLIVMFYLAYLGFEGRWVGVLLWPAVAVHAALTILLVRARAQKNHVR